MSMNKGIGTAKAIKESDRIMEKISRTHQKAMRMIIGLETVLDRVRGMRPPAVTPKVEADTPSNKDLEGRGFLMKVNCEIDKTLVLGEKVEALIIELDDIF